MDDTASHSPYEKTVGQGSYGKSMNKGEPEWVGDVEPVDDWGPVGGEVEELGPSTEARVRDGISRKDCPRCGADRTDYYTENTHTVVGAITLLFGVLTLPVCLGLIFIFWGLNLLCKSVSWRHCAKCDWLSEPHYG